MKKDVISMFSNQIADDGTLFIGHSERIQSLTDQFTQLQIPQGFCYQKNEHIANVKGSQS